MNAERQHKCTICPRAFATARALGDHKRDSHATQAASKASALGPQPVANPSNVRRLRGPPVGRKRGGARFPGVIGVASVGVQLPELTHKLTLEDRLFIDNYLNPCDERLGPNSGSKVPDGTLPNSGINGFREVFNVAPPFDIPSSPGPMGGPLWSLIIMKLPVIREAIYLIATNSRDDLSPQNQVDIATAYNQGRVAIFPDWAEVVQGNASLKISRVVWSQLRTITNLRNLFKQVRIAKSGYTTFHNAPDLYNQGMVITAQWNLDNSPRGLITTTSPEPLLRASNFPLTWTVDGASLTGGVLGTPTGAVPLVSAAQPTPTSPIGTVNVPIQTLGVVGEVGFASNQVTPRNPLELNGLLNVTITNDGQALTVILTTTDAEGLEHVLTRPVSPIAGGTVQLEWFVNALRATAAGTDIELPPLDTQTIVQSTPKAVILPMKQYNGAYSVLRAWEPVFEMQETDNLGPIQWSRRGASPIGSSAQRDPELVDLNFGTSVQAIMGISLAASVTIKVIQDIEFVAGDDSPWQGFMNPNVNVDTEVISLARAISLDQPFAFPQTYNSMGTLLDGVESLLSHIPIIGQAVPLVSKMVRGLFGNTSNNEPHPELQGGNVQQLVMQLLQALGLK
ncbi:MAG: capsid protein [Guiyang nodavirus 2]|nr:MAG: capsid protein [Guiyang nodavirus 2]